MAIISISGEMFSGKDTVGNIIQYLLWKDKVEKATIPFSNYSVLDFINRNYDYKGQLSEWEIRKWADKLKDIVCIILNCTRAELEDRNFKEKELGEEWWIYKSGKYIFTVDTYNKYKDKNGYDYIKNSTIVKLTPRKLLQLLGTECGRDIIHPNIWINTLMSEYKSSDEVKSKDTIRVEGGYQIVGHGEHNGKIISTREFCYKVEKPVYPNWIITDTRFPNEMQAVKDREGISIQVIRTLHTSDEWQKIYPDVVVLDPDGWDRQDWEYSWNQEVITKNTYIERIFRSTIKGTNLFPDYFNAPKHESETSLDDYKFDYIIDNNSGIQSLIEKVKIILEKEKIL